MEHSDIGLEAVLRLEHDAAVLVARHTGLAEVFEYRVGELLAPANHRRLAVEVMGKLSVRPQKKSARSKCRYISSTFQHSLAELDAMQLHAKMQAKARRALLSIARRWISKFNRAH